MSDFGRRPTHGNTHEYGGVDEINAALLAGRINLIDMGDVLDNHFTVSDFTTDLGIYELDLSSIIPVRAGGILFRLTIEATTAQAWINFGKKGITQLINVVAFRTQAGGLVIDGDFFCACDANRVILYRAANATWTTIDFIVRAYFI